MPANRRFVLRERPEGRIDPETFELVEEELPEIGDGEALVRTEWISLDPTNRAWINDMPGYLPPVAIGETMRGLGLGRVVESKHPDYEEGQLVQGLIGWTENFVASDAAPLQRVPEIEGVSPSSYLGVLGMTGLTAWVGMREIGKPRRARPSSSPPPPARSARSPASSPSATAPAWSASPAGPRSARCSPSASASTPPSTTGPTTGGSSSPPPRRTASTSTSRTSAARSWTRSSPASTSTPGSPSAG